METPIRRSLSRDGTAIVDVLGEIDFTNADEVSRGIQAAVAQWSPQIVQVNLREATFIDSTGLGALIAGYRAAVESHARFVVVDPGDAFRRVLAVTGLCELFGLPEQEHPADAGRTSDIAL